MFVLDLLFSIILKPSITYHKVILSKLLFELEALYWSENEHDEDDISLQQASNFCKDQSQLGISSLIGIDL